MQKFRFFIVTGMITLLPVMTSLTGPCEATDKEIAMLVHMREEEKLARDVYSLFADMWELQIFSNITSSENRHLSAVVSLLERYSPSDTIVSEPGHFTIPEMQGLYDTLIDKGSSSLTEALRAGATIEDIDLKDLDNFKAMTSDEDIIMVFENLYMGSQNHMRAFNRQLQSRGIAYAPQYIEQEVFDTIISTPMEHGHGHGPGGNGDQ
jgi:hypothetical protein